LILGLTVSSIISIRLEPFLAKNDPKRHNQTEPKGECYEVIINNLKYSCFSFNDGTLNVSVLS
jgi:hypothetical protein